MAKKNPVALAVLPRPTVPLANAAQNLASVCDAIDNGMNPKDALVKIMFSRAVGDVERSVTEHIAFKHFLEGSAEMAKTTKAAWETARKRLFVILEEFEELMKGAIEAKPDQPYSSPIGTLAVHKNPPSVELAWGDDSVKITKSLLGLYGVPDEFVNVKTEYSIKKAEVAAAIKSGRAFGWAILKQDTTLKVTT